MKRYLLTLLYLSITLMQKTVYSSLIITIKTTGEITAQEWIELKKLFVESFFAACRNVNERDLALMNNNITTFWSIVFDRDKPQVMEEKYKVILYKKDDIIIAYGLYTFFNDIKYVYIRHLCVNTEYQGQGLGKKLIMGMETSHQDARKTGLFTRTYNRTAQDFYTHVGFCIATNPPDTLIKYYAGDRVYMERAIK